MRHLSVRRHLGLAATGAVLLALVVPVATGSSRALAQASSVTISHTQGSPDTKVAVTGTATQSSAPAAPYNVKVVPYGALDFLITWSDNAISFGGQFQVYNGVTTQTVDTTLPYQYLWAAQPNQYMCFAVRAYNSSGYSAWAGMWTCATTPPGGQPAVPRINILAGPRISRHPSTRWPPAMRTAARTGRTAREQLCWSDPWTGFSARTGGRPRREAALPSPLPSEGRAGRAHPDVITVASHMKKDNPTGLPCISPSPPVTLQVPTSSA